VHRRLSAHPLNRGRKLKANMVLLRGAGQFRTVEPFEKRYGMRACCIAGGALYRGIAHYLGMHVPVVRGATGDFNTDLYAKARAAVAHLSDYDFVYMHVKAMDSAGHDGDTKKRVEMLQRIDRIVPMLTKTGAVVFVCGDHSTPPTKKEHSFEPVPIAIGNVEARNYGIKKFCEVECAKGELGRITGADVMRLVLAYSGRAEKYGT
ncbi:MAG: phosphoglycerate mutase, partial [Candidatus Micrarchaeia archaeon]